ncbi:MAG: amino acid adenylation domain-containing protein [Candidatus Binatus sp.]|uniref:amino acid adenylation domain-containing protein n=1 Tax=Candidatus Binatus sp. TaxID=2811406 RepID=UPI003BB115DD
MPTLPSFLYAAASRHAAHPALSMDDQVLTYAELDASANRIANALIRQGVRIGDRVGMWMPKSLEAIASIWGILKAGAAFVPIDPSAPVSRLATIARDCEIRALVTAMDRADDLHDEFSAGAPMRAVFYSGDGAGPVRGALWSSLRWNEVEAESADPAPVHIYDNALALVQYTSGSGGAPKGVAISHRALVGQAEWTVTAFGLSIEDRIPGCTPLSSAMSTFEIFGGARAGATVYPVPPQLAPFPAAVAKSWSDQRITLMYVVASVLQMLLNRGNLSGLDFTALRTIVVGGEHLPAQRLNELMRLLPHVRFVIMYGRTEAKLRSVHEVKFPPKEIDTRTIGKVSADTRLLVLDENEHPVAVGAIGELWIAGPCLMLGYYGLPEMTAEFMRTVTLSPDDSVLACRTGDIVRQRADGTLELLGRADQQIKVRGHRVETPEIEIALCRHPAVQAAAVIAVPDPETGNRLKAIVVLKDGSAADEQTLRSHCAAELSSYMVPEAIVFRASLPLMSNGKVDRRSLRESA